MLTPNINLVPSSPEKSKKGKKEGARKRRKQVLQNFLRSLSLLGYPSFFSSKNNIFNILRMPYFGLRFS
jgi:hypothetical protein